MKKLFTLFITLFCVQFLFAQNFVSTTPENKNVILEEFTGIHCGYCPDGHLMAQNFHDANPGDVVLINIHTGSYANPSPGNQISEHLLVLQLMDKQVYLDILLEQ